MKRMVIGAALVAAIGLGCSDDDDGGTPPPTATPVPTATVAPTSTAIPSATAEPTATPDEHEHREVEIGSTEDGGGALAANFDYERPISLFFNSCIGGEGDECSGGIRLYSAPNPGFVPHAHDHEAEGSGGDHGEGGGHEDEIFELAGDTALSIEIIAITAGLSMTIEGERLDEPGQSAALGTTPDFHADVETFLALEDDDSVEGDYRLSFRLLTDSPTYDDSAEYEIHFAAADEGHEHEDEHTD